MSQLTPDADLDTPPVHHRDTCARMSRCLGYLKQSKLGEAHARDPREVSQSKQVRKGRLWNPRGSENTE